MSKCGEFAIIIPKKMIKGRLTLEPYTDTKAIINLNIILKADAELLFINSTELERKLEEEKHNPYITLITKKHPRWFYQDYAREIDIPIKEDEIRELVNQARVELDERDFQIAQELLYSVDSRGYLTVSIKEIADALSVDIKDVERVRKFVAKELEPTGVCCKNLQEFISIQLQELYQGQDLLHKKVTEALRTGKLDKESREILSHLKLSPLSGNTVYRSGPIDIVVDYVENDWVVFLYEDFIDIQVKEGLEEANDILKKAKNLKLIIQIRRDVLKKVVHEVLKAQEGFLVSDKPLKKLTLTELANNIGISVSTISRIVNRKYIKTPSGVYPLRFFFVRESVKGYSVEEVTRFIKDAVQQLGEGATDMQISQHLANLGINLSRRTVNKYRNNL